MYIDWDTWLTALSDGRLTFDGAPPSNTISGFAAGDTIDLAGVGFSRGNTVASAAGVVTVSAGGSHFAVHLAPSGLVGGTFHLKPDGNEDTATGAGGTVIGYDQIASVASGQTSTNVWVGDAHVQVVLSGAAARGTTVADGGEQDVFGTASGTVLNGTEVVYGKGSGATIGFSGLQYIYSGGPATGAIVSGGNSDQQAYGVASNTSALAGGALFVGARGSSVDALIGNAGNEFIISGGTGIGTTISGSGVLEVADGSILGSSTNLTFAGTGGTLQVNDTTMPTAVIGGFAPGDTLAFTGLGQILSPKHGLTGVTLLSGNVLQLTTQDIFFDIATYDLRLDALQSFTGQFQVEIGTDILGFPGSVEIFLSAPSGPVVSGGTTFGSTTSTGRRR
jgi:autotransporter passenger strand-loop-strand repeat protein